MQAGSGWDAFWGVPDIAPDGTRAVPKCFLTVHPSPQLIPGSPTTTPLVAAQLGRPSPARPCPAPSCAQQLRADPPAPRPTYKSRLRARGPGHSEQLRRGDHTARPAGPAPSRTVPPDPDPYPGLQLLQLTVPPKLRAPARGLWQFQEVERAGRVAVGEDLGGLGRVSRCRFQKLGRTLGKPGGWSGDRMRRLLWGPQSRPPS